MSPQQLSKPYVEIISNGSHCYGEPPDSIERLLEVLEDHPLDPRFERLGGFIRPTGEKLSSCISIGYDFFGNFLTVSHVFHIVTNDAGTIDKLVAAIQGNQQKLAYRLVKARLEHDRRELELEREQKRLRQQAERGKK